MCRSQRSAFQQNFTNSSGKCAGLHTIKIRPTGCIKSESLYTCLFKELCKDMNSTHDVLLFYTSVRSLSKGNVLTTFVRLRTK